MEELNKILDKIEDIYYNFDGNELDKSNYLTALWTEYYKLSDKLDLEPTRAYNLYLMGENESYIIDAKPTKKEINITSLEEALNNYKNNNYLTHKEVKLILDSVINFTWSMLERLAVNLDNSSLNGYCELAQALSLLPLESINLKVTKNRANKCFNYPFNHNFGTVTFNEKIDGKIEEKTYLIDPTYRQFFTSIRCNEGRYYTEEENTGKKTAPDPGYFVKDKSFAKELISNGYIELTKINAYKYGSSFYLSGLLKDNKEKEIDINYYQNIIDSKDEYKISLEELDMFNYNYLKDIINNKRKK